MVYPPSCLHFEHRGTPILLYPVRTNVHFLHLSSHQPLFFHIPHWKELQTSLWVYLNLCYFILEASGIWLTANGRTRGFALPEGLQEYPPAGGVARWRGCSSQAIAVHFSMPLPSEPSSLLIACI